MNYWKREKKWQNGKKIKKIKKISKYIVIKMCSFFIHVLI